MGALDAEERARRLVHSLADAGLVKRGIRHSACNVLAAAEALEAASAGDDVETIPLGQVLQHEQRSAPVRFWMRLLRKLGGQLVSPVVVDRGRGAKRPCLVSDEASVWRLSDTASLTPQGLPSQPIVWRAAAARDVGAGCGSAVRCAHLLEDLVASGGVELYLSDMSDAVSRSVSWASNGGWRRAYMRAHTASSRTRARLMEVALGDADGTATRQPAGLAAAGLRLAWAPAPKACEGVAQVWLNFEAGTCSLHHDAPDGMLVCLGGERRVLLLPPGAPSRFSIAKHRRGTRFVRDFDAFDVCTDGLSDGGLAQVATLTPGMALFIPSGWWHQVRASAGGVAISVAACCGVGQPLCSVGTEGGV